jgi:glutaminyl-tRNA synthetase
VRLRYACLLTCTSAETDEAGNVVRLRCTWDPASRGGKSPDGRKVKGTLHWVSAKHAIAAEVRLYDRLFTESNPQKDGADFRQFLNPNSRELVHGCMLERALGDVQGERAFQLERLGYFCMDRDSKPGAPVLNRTIELRDTWAKIEKQLGAG